MDPIKKKIFEESGRIVIKIGSSLITDTSKGLINKPSLNNIVNEIASLLGKGKEIVVVSSGAVALGKKTLKIMHKNLKLSEKQAAASVGQVMLINAWKTAFSKLKISCGQILLTHFDTENRRSALNARNTFEALMKSGAIPIINENDTVATKELKHGDNDQLAARVAQIFSADLLIILSDIEGLYSSNPKRKKDAKLFDKVYDVSKNIEKMSENTSSIYSVGGMQTKIKAAKISLAIGCHMIITKGTGKSPINNLIKGKKATWFISKISPKSARKSWISAQLKINGSITVDSGAEKALINGASLLPAGILSISGNFDKGDIINVFNVKKKVICTGITAYPANEAKIIAGAKSDEIEKLLGYHSKDVVIHRDDMIIR